MGQQLEDFEDVSLYSIEDAHRERLLAAHQECSVVWTTRDGWPVGVVHMYVWREGSFWVTCTERRKRVPALRARAESCVIVPFAHEATVTAKTLATVHEPGNAHTEWFYPALAALSMPDQPDNVKAEGVEGFVKRLESDSRVIIELVPQKWITFDGNKVRAHAEGRWAPGQPWDGRR